MINLQIEIGIIINELLGKLIVALDLGRMAENLDVLEVDSVAKVVDPFIVFVGDLLKPLIGLVKFLVTLNLVGLSLL